MELGSEDICAKLNGLKLRRILRFLCFHGVHRYIEPIETHCQGCNWLTWRSSLYACMCLCMGLEKSFLFPFKLLVVTGQQFYSHD